ncbi:overproduction-induced pheromone-resistant [Extremus antarcticus]|uniref:Overproduction-induced pheromone-resistant n=1 Tax=Extremus antarcticus TaxID=702011 RepID=A0AAJ0GAP4_9PEZI|nr:overproduction-induced pheromone-resistant [Extremus antarcticus]
MAMTVKGSLMSGGVEHTLRTIFKRCLKCPPGVTPSCPTCGKGEICSLIPQSCGSCAHNTCIPDPSFPVSHGPNVGAIAGGVVGGIAFIVVVVLCIYIFWIKKRRAEQDAELEEEWANDEISSQKRSTQFTTMGDAASTRTRGSLAASILSRASNIIQIAYIPGVTNRNGSGHNSIHAPVPPIPAHHRSQAPKSPLSNEGDALFFRPGDLRDSTWSGSSSINSDKRDTRYTMASISPSLMRDSVGSDIFTNDASSQPMPATAATRLAPRMVSVKSSTSSASLSGTSDSGTATPQETSGKVKTLQVMMPGQGAGLAPSNSFRSAGKVKQVTVGSKGRFPVRNVSDASTVTSTSSHAPNISSPLAEKDESEASASGSQGREASSLMQNMDFATPPAVQPMESPFFDATEHPSAAARAASSLRLNPYASMARTVGSSTDGPARSRGKSIGGLSAVEEEALKRASRTSESLFDVDERTRKSEESPFADSHSTD